MTVAIAVAPASPRAVAPHRSGAEPEGAAAFAAVLLSAASTVTSDPDAAVPAPLAAVPESSADAGAAEEPTSPVGAGIAELHVAQAPAAPAPVASQPLAPAASTPHDDAATSGPAAGHADAEEPTPDRTEPAPTGASTTAAGLPQLATDAAPGTATHGAALGTAAGPRVISASGSAAGRADAAPAPAPAPGAELPEPTPGTPGTPGTPIEPPPAHRGSGDQVLTSARLEPGTTRSASSLDSATAAPGGAQRGAVAVPPDGASAASATPVVSAAPAGSPASEASTALAAPVSSMSGAAAASASSGPTTFAPQTEVFAVTGSAAAPSPSRTADTLASQLARPVLSVATSAPGTHELTVRVTPEHLGPVSVRAIVSPDGVRIELLAPGEAGREALRQVLGDLRRDLITAGLTATLDVSPRDAGTGTGAGTGPGSDPRFGHEPATGDQPATRDPRHPSDRSSDHPSDSTPGTESQPAMNGGAAASTLDVIA